MFGNGNYCVVQGSSLAGDEGSEKRDSFIDKGESIKGTISRDHVM